MSNLGDPSIFRLIKGVTILSSTDTLRRAAGLIKMTDGSRLPVTNGESIQGVISERAIAGFVSASSDVDEALDSPIEPIIDRDVTLINVNTTIKQAAGVFATTGDDMLPVIGDGGAFCGVIYRRDVVASLARNLKPPAIGGMATPLGVHLSTGSISGGAGSLGLFLTGASMAVMILVASFAVDWLEKLFVRATGINLTMVLQTSRAARVLGIPELPFYVYSLLSILVFFVIMRLVPLSGYHAAEHMTVHAIEAGEPLSADIVRRMPRVHPRCGTNLLAGAGIFASLAIRLTSGPDLLLALMVMVLFWRKVGGWLQYFVTTKPPSDRQLASGIAAGKQLLNDYQDKPNYQANAWQRILNFGFPQTAAGMFITLWIADSVLKLKLM